MGLRVMRAAVCVTIVALVSGSVALTGGAAFGATSVDDLVVPVPIDSPTGSYIVLLEEPPAATYDGGQGRLAATMPDEGEKLDPRSPEVRNYTEHLRERQREIAGDAGVEPSATYQIVLNGFSAAMTPDAAARVAATDGVLAVYADEIFRPDGVPDAHAALQGRDRGSGVAARAGGRRRCGSRRRRDRHGHRAGESFVRR